MFIAVYLFCSACMFQQHKQHTTSLSLKLQHSSLHGTDLPTDTRGSITTAKQKHKQMKKFDRSHEAKCRNDHWFTNTAPVGLYMLNIRSFVQHDDYVETTHERKNITHRHVKIVSQNRKQQYLLVQRTSETRYIPNQPTNERTITIIQQQFEEMKDFSHFAISLFHSIYSHI